MHQVSLETICPLKAFQLHYCPDNDAKSIVKHFIFLQKFSVIVREFNQNQSYVDEMKRNHFLCFDRIVNQSQLWMTNKINHGLYSETRTHWKYHRICCPNQMNHDFQNIKYDEIICLNVMNRHVIRYILHLLIG